MIDSLPRIQLQVATQRTAREQYWRHVANRTCLAILADHRTPLSSTLAIEERQAA